MNNNDGHLENVLACTFISKHHHPLVTMSTTAILENKKNKHSLTSHSVKFYEVCIGNNCNFKILTFFCNHATVPNMSMKSIPILF